MRVDTVESRLVGLAQVGRCIHTGQQHRQLPGLQFFQYRRQVGACDLGGDGAQTVVGAERKDHQIRVVDKRPFEPGKPAGRSITGNPGVEHLDGCTPVIECAFQLRREAVRGGQAIAGRQAVAQRQNTQRLFGRAQPRPGNAQDQQQQSGKVRNDFAIGGSDTIVHCDTLNEMVEKQGAAILTADGPPQQQKWIVDLSDVHVTLNSSAGAVHILRGIDLQIAAGETVSVVGPSGAGKSTMMMIMAGLEHASSGSVRVAGRELTEMDEDALAIFRRDHVGIVFQAFHLVPTMTALENVAIPLEFAGCSDAFERAQDELVAVGLGHRLGHYPSQLSGGEQQRVALARALVPSPALLLADEPTGNLDGATGAQIVELMFELSARRDATLVLITHDMKLAERCRRNIRVADGLVVDSVAADGTAATA